MWILFCQHLVIFGILFFGYALGRITIKGVSLGDAGVFIIALLFQPFIKSNVSYEFDNSNVWNKKNKTKNKMVKKYKDKSYKDLEFDREADLWGLSKEDRRIAKEERMSPADFIEAEERDDDELLTDEWEDK